MTKSAEKAEVKIGQRYEDADKRYPGRVVEVTGFTVDARSAFVRTPNGRHVRIQIARLQGKWYRLLGNKKEEGQ